MFKIPSNLKIIANTIILLSQSRTITLREKCPSTDQKKPRICILFTQCKIKCSKKEKVFFFFSIFLANVLSINHFNKNNKCSFSHYIKSMNEFYENC